MKDLDADMNMITGPTQTHRRIHDTEETRRCNGGKGASDAPNAAATLPNTAPTVNLNR